MSPACKLIKAITRTEQQIEPGVESYLNKSTKLQKLKGGAGNFPPVL